MGCGGSKGDDGGKNKVKPAPNNNKKDSNNNRKGNQDKNRQGNNRNDDKNNKGQRGGRDTDKEKADKQDDWDDMERNDSQYMDEVRQRIKEEKARMHLGMSTKDQHIGYLQRSIEKFEKLDLQEQDRELRDAKRKLSKMKKHQSKEAEIKRLKKNLRQGMNSRQLEELDEGIQEAEESGYREVEPLLDKAREVRDDLERLEQYKQKDKYLRGQLKEATEARDKEQLEEAIAGFRAAHLNDKGDLTKARSTLLELYEDETEEALEEQDSDRVQEILEGVGGSVISRDLADSDVIARAERYLQQERRLRKYLSPILKLKKSTVAEIQCYQKPVPVTHDVMQATLITLGNQPSEVADWKSIQKQLNPSTKIIKRIRRFRMYQLQDRSAQKAEQLLDSYTTDDVREVSAGVATFYRWSNNMIEEAKGNKDEDEVSKQGSDTDDKNRDRKGRESNGRAKGGTRNEPNGGKRKVKIKSETPEAEAKNERAKEKKKVDSHRGNKYDDDDRGKETDRSKKDDNKGKETDRSKKGETKGQETDRSRKEENKGKETDRRSKEDNKGKETDRSKKGETKGQETDRSRKEENKGKETDRRSKGDNKGKETDRSKKGETKGKETDRSRKEDKNGKETDRGSKEDNKGKETDRSKKGETKGQETDRSRKDESQGKETDRSGKGNQTNRSTKSNRNDKKSGDHNEDKSNDPKGGPQKETKANPKKEPQKDTKRK